MPVNAVLTNTNNKGGYMKSNQNAFATVCTALLLAGCGTVDYKPGTADSTKPSINLLVRRAGSSDLEVQTQQTPASPLAANLGSIPNDRVLDFSILATAKDPESGIKHIVLKLNRTVCYRTAAGDIAQAYFATKTRKEASYTDPHNAPTDASLGDTGLIDDVRPPNGNLVDANLLMWKNANQTPALGVGVATKWFAEATNQAGQTIYSEAIYVSAGDLSCNPAP
jgi:hypothetical protein